MPHAHQGKKQWPLAPEVQPFHVSHGDSGSDGCVGDRFSIECGGSTSTPSHGWKCCADSTLSKSHCSSPQRSRDLKQGTSSTLLFDRHDSDSVI